MLQIILNTPVCVKSTRFTLCQYRIIDTLKPKLGLSKPNLSFDGSGKVHHVLMVKADVHSVHNFTPLVVDGVVAFLTP
jgi:hypothetical protein